MKCPSCSNQNLPGVEQCVRCQTDLAPLDRPTPHDQVESSLMTDPVSILNPRKPVTIAATANIAEAMQQMIQRGVGALLVTDRQHHLVGILTERDFLTKVAGEIGFEQQLVQTAMSPNPETVSPADPLAFALRTMDVGGYRHLPVVNESGTPVGVISIRDVLKHVTRLCRDLPA